MQFENEPEGWDDHIIENPPSDEPETGLEPATGAIIGFALGVAIYGTLGLTIWALGRWMFQ